MTDRDTLIVGGMLGAVAGLAVGYLFFTDEGRRLREDVEPSIETLMREAGKLSAAVDQVRRGVSDFKAEARDAWPRRSA